MPKKNTQCQVIYKFKQVHGNKYDYSLVYYINLNTKVTIIYPFHGKFKQIPRSHISGHGCSKCGVKYSSDKNRLTQEEFIKRAKEKFGNKFTYEDTIYQNNQKPVTITCKIHGHFRTKPGTLLAHETKYGCKFCYFDSKKITLKQFLSNSQIVHKGKYDYSNITEIDNYQTKVPIICKKHGVYKTTISIHLAGFGCPTCQKENHKGGYTKDYFDKHPNLKNTPGTLYIVKFHNKDNEWIKIGISSSFNNRFRGYSRNGFHMTPIKILNMPIYEAFQLEQHILSQKRERFIPRDKSFHGRYECFKVSELDSIIKEIESIYKKLIQIPTE